MITAEAMELPTEREIELMPLAMPVCSTGTLAAIRAGMEA